MWIAIGAALLVSIDALFIGISLGTQKRCRFWYLLVINAGLLALCFAGFFIARALGDLDFDFDIVVGISFITLGAWFILYYFLFEHKKYKQGEVQMGRKTIIMTGILMSVEAMLITLGLTLVYQATSAPIIIPIVVGVAHFVYCTATFFMAKYLRKFPHWVGHVISGIALIIYGIMALVI
ncbi:MAG: hypothetical protein FWE31_05325 [Firmicutes bacterium]|nr:hypothetical protein [Bacillota bacterium]